MAKKIKLLRIISSFGIIMLLYNCSKPTEACFSFYPNENISTQTLVVFDAACSKNVSYYTWDYGDGTTENSIQGKTTTEHTYSISGTYEVKLISKRKDGVTIKKDNKYSISKTIIVN